MDKEDSKRQSKNSPTCANKTIKGDLLQTPRKKKIPRITNEILQFMEQSISYWNRNITN